MSMLMLEKPSLGLNTIPVRGYQTEAINAIRNEFTRGKKRTLLILPTGTGKTVTFGNIARKVIQAGGRSLILAHRGELIDQAVNTLNRIGVECGVEKAGSYARSIFEPDCVVATVQTMQRDRLESWDADHFKLIIIDECFPAGTMVDNRPIETIRVGDLVRSFNHETGQVENRMVTRLMKRPASGLVRVDFADGRSIVCTPEHPFCVKISDNQHRYIAANRLSPYNMVVSITSPSKGTHGNQTESLRGLRDDVHSAKLDHSDGSNLLTEVQIGTPSGTGEVHHASLLELRNAGQRDRETTSCFSGPGHGVLHRDVQNGIQVSNFIGDGGTNEPDSRIGSNEGTEPDGVGDNAGQGFNETSGNAVGTADPRGKRSRPDGNAIGVGSSVGVADGTCDQDGALPGRKRVSVLLQDRHCQCGSYDCDRSGRELAPDESGKDSRRKERCILDLARVASVEVLERRSDGGFGGVCPDGFVFNLEVAGNHNYFVDGVLVHNCHHATASTYQNIINHFSGAVVLGVTATADRADEDKLQDVFESVAYEMSLWEAMTAPDPGPFLCRLKIVQCDVDIDLRDIRTTGGDFNQADLEAIITPLIEVLANAIRQEVGGRSTLIFTPDVGSAQAMASALQSMGLRADWISGDSRDRAFKLSQYQSGKTQILVNCALLTEGFDAPRTAAIVLCRPTKSRPLYAQMVGRGTRLAPDKPDCLVVDFNYLTSKHDLVKPVDLFDTTHTDDDVLKIAAEIIAKGTDKDLVTAIEKATVENEERKVLRIQAREREIKYKRVSYDPLAVADVLGIPARGMKNATMNRATSAQINALKKFGVEGAEGMTKARACSMLGTLVSRCKQNLASMKQTAWLLKLGVEPAQARAMTFAEASAFLDSKFKKRA